MSKWTVDQLGQAIAWLDAKYRRHGEDEDKQCADMLREYAAHFAAQAEWPSDDVAGEVLRKFEGTVNDGGVDYLCRRGRMRAALQSVRPPAGVVSDDRAALLYLMQQFDDETWQCPNCGHAEDTATTDSAHYLRDYLASSIERKVSDGVMTPIEALQAICDAHKFNSASLPPHRVHEIAQSAITRHLSRPAEHEHEWHMRNEGVVPTDECECGAVRDSKSHVLISGSQPAERGEAAWKAIVEQCMVTEAVTPEESDPYGTISQLIDYHVANTAPPPAADAERGEAVAPAAEVSKLLAHAERMGYMVDTAVPLDLLRSILTALTATPPAAGVPDAMKQPPQATKLGDQTVYHEGYCTGWNACRDAMLSATPSPTIDVAAVHDWQRDCPDYPNCPNLSCRCDPANRPNHAIGDAK